MKAGLPRPGECSKVDAGNGFHQVREQVPEEAIALVHVQLQAAEEVETERLAGKHIGPQTLLVDHRAGFPIDGFPQDQLGDVERQEIVALLDVLHMQAAAQLAAFALGGAMDADGQPPVFAPKRLQKPGRRLEAAIGDLVDLVRLQD